MKTETKHTPETWIVRQHNDGHQIWHESGGLRSLIATINDFNVCPEHGGSSVGNAVRIVDCVNACAGIDDADLDFSTDSKRQNVSARVKACADRGRLAEQNRELAAALDRCVRELDAAYYGISTLPAEHFGRLAVEEARAVLAKVTA